jgi:uncharacterized protein
MPPPFVTHLLYLHGFRSSPRSTKARQVEARVRQRHPGVTWWCPQLPPSPAAAMAMVMKGIEGWPREQMAAIGSSLGGFYATWVAQSCECRAVLLNPAVHPARDLAGLIPAKNSISSRDSSMNCARWTPGRCGIPRNFSQ